MAKQIRLSPGSRQVLMRRLTGVLQKEKDHLRGTVQFLCVTNDSNAAPLRAGIVYDVDVARDAADPATREGLTRLRAGPYGRTCA